MKQAVGIALLLAVSCAWAQHAHESGGSAMPLPGLGDLHHPVTTSNTEAQRYFDQGLRLAYAFNHDEARRSFEKAAELDPGMAMAWWGVAYVEGPNYNLPMDAEREKAAYAALRKAQAVSGNASAAEKAYIEALAARYTGAAHADFDKLNAEYAQAMRRLWQRYPDDPDAGTLFAESMMLLRPWELWNHEGTPAPGTEEIVKTLETVLRRHPEHMGAIHFYIHAVEASPHPENALSYADRLRAMNLTGAGHLQHMPGHIYFRTGDYDATVEANIRAVAADEHYEKMTGHTTGIYPLMYHAHDLHFLAIAAAMEGRCGDAVQAAEELANHVRGALAEMPMVQIAMAMPMEIDVRCERWNDALGRPAPDPKYPVMAAMYHYGRGMALVATGKGGEGAREEAELAAIMRATPKDELLRHNNNMPDVFTVADDVLQARLAEAKGNRAEAIRRLRAAVAVQDAMHYDEPPDWYFPVRESLGGALLRAGDAKAAEEVFREDLARYPRNPRSLFGLAEALTRQGRDYDAGWVRKEFESAWKGTDLHLGVDRL